MDHVGGFYLQIINGLWISTKYANRHLLNGVNECITDSESSSARESIVFPGTCFCDISLLLLHFILFTRPEVTAFLISFHAVIRGSSCWPISSYLCFLCGSSGFSVFSYVSTFDIDIGWTTSYKMKTKTTLSKQLHNPTEITWYVVKYIHLTQMHHRASNNHFNKRWLPEVKICLSTKTSRLIDMLRSCKWFKQEIIMHRLLL